MVNDHDVVLGRDDSACKKWLGFLAITVIYFFYCYNFMIGTFVKPTMIADIASGGLGFTLKQTEEIFAVMSLGTIPGTFLFGYISSRIGKKKTLMIVAILIGLSTYIPLLDAESIRLWEISRFFCGVVLGGVFGAAMPLIADMFPKKYRGKLAAILTALFSLAMIFGGKLYGILGDAHWKALVYTAVIPPVIGAILVYIFVPDDAEHARSLLKESQQHGEKINYFSMYKGKYFWIGLGVILLSGANFTAYSAFSNNATTYLVNQVGLTAATAGAIYSFQGVGQLIGYLSWGTISDRFGRKVPLVGMALSALAIFIYTRFNAHNVTSFYFISVIIGFCVGFSGPWGAYYSELFPEKFRALSAGISFNGGRIFSSFAIPQIAGLASPQTGMMPIFWASMVVFVLGTVIWAFLPETLNREKKSAS